MRSDTDFFSVGGDFARLLERAGVPTPLSRSAALIRDTRAERHEPLGAHGTTVIALKYDGGVLNVADRRATAATGILYDEAEKILKLDDYTLIAIAGAYAQAAEAARYLRHAFKYFARSQLQEMSLEGKLAEVSRVLAQSVPSLLQGIGGFVPVISAFDVREGEGRIFFYDVLGARFEGREYSAAGSGAEKIRGALDYIVRRSGPFREMELDDVLREALLLLDVAAGLDPATSGLAGVLPLAKTITAEGISDLPEERIREIQQELTGR
jgi:proteasome beta subunit